MTPVTELPVLVAGRKHLDVGTLAAETEGEVDNRRQQNEVAAEMGRETVEAETEVSEVLVSSSVFDGSEAPN